MAKERLDKIVVERGLAESRARAQAMILAGQVLVRDQRIDKPGQLIDADAEIRIKGETLRYAGRGGLKLEAALKEFAIDVSGKRCLDVGASTGGFTDCLLQHGAERVWAVDVGHNQIVWRLRQDPRVELLEGVNARNLDPSHFPVSFDMATIDVSFISLATVLAPVARLLKDSADCVALVKPQFEVGRGEVGRGGIVKDPMKHRRVLEKIRVSALESGLIAVGLIVSPILGAEGNREFLIHLKPRGGADEAAVSIADRILELTSD
ncbi:MAG TPA: TlyA family RNA methyltransferase [Blastocatellia bacterium]|nr:TlyA family RNA methyltransferase [Blastocatellia bacterium]